MMTLPYNLMQLYEKGWLGVKLTCSEPIEVSDGENGATIEPNVVYPVVYISLQYNRGIFSINDDNAFVFDFATDNLEFEDTHSEVLN